MASKEEIENLRNKYLNGGFGYGDAKKLLLEKILEYFSEIRKRYFEFKKDPSYVLQVLKKGAEEANKIANETMEQVFKAVGII